MHTENIIEEHTRPNLTIKVVGGRQLGRCYSETTYHVTSLSPLSKEKLTTLWQAGLIGVGQQFNCSLLDAEGKRHPADTRLSSGEDVLNFIEVDSTTRKPTGRVAINPYTKKPQIPARMSYYTYECVVTCDSGD